MKSTVLYSIALLALVFTGCSKDLGNYDYHDVNRITITGLNDEVILGNRIYNLPFRDTMILRPIVTGSLSKEDHSNLAFEWKVDGIVVGEQKDLFYVADKKYGRLGAEFSVRDKSTGIKSTYNCMLDVINPYKLGYYALTKNSADEASLHCLSTIRADAKWEEVVLPSLGKLGKNPLTISGVYKPGVTQGDYHNILTLAVQDSPHPVVNIDSRQFVPTLLYNSSSYVLGGDFLFRPSQVLVDVGNDVIFAVNNGKLHVLRMGTIGAAPFADAPYDYQVRTNGIAAPVSNTRFHMSIYDDRNKEIRVWDNGFSRYEYVYVNAYDNISGKEIMKGQTYLFGSFAWINGTNYIYLFQQGNRLYSYRLDFNSARRPESFVKQAEGVVPADGAIGLVEYDRSANSWYLSIGKSIYKASYLGLEFQKYLELPQSAKGSIATVKWGWDKIVVATNDASVTEKKGSIYMYNAITLALEESYEYVMDEIVDIHIGT